MSRFEVNPALGPTRPWVRTPSLEPRADPVVIEADILIRNLRPPGTAAIKALARDSRPVTAQDLADQLGGTDAQAVDQALHQANQFAEAFGFLPLVQRDEHGYHLDPEASSVVEAAALLGY